MKKPMKSGLTVTALVTAFGTGLFLVNSPARTLASSPDNASTPALAITSSTDNLAVNSNSTDLGDSTNPTTASDVTNALPAPRFLDIRSSQNTAIASVIPHAWQGNRLGVTVRVKNIPIVTVLGSVEELQAAAQQQPITAPNSAMARAQAIADQFNQLGQDSNFDAKTITVAYDKAQRLYHIQVKGRDILRLDAQTVLPDQTRLSAKNALQMTNRLRRVMGDAPALTAIANAPVDAQQPITGTSNLGDSGEATLRQRIRGGIASWYGPGFHGRRTANGERYNQHGLTAAHKSLPFGTRVLVTNLVTGRSVMVRINDRGPFIRGRVIDLSAGAAKAIGVYGRGTAPVALEVIRD